MTRIPRQQIGEMYSKRVHRLIKIIGFLFCTIGLLFISAKILAMNEGFQGGETCTKIENYRGKDTWLCDTEMDAKNKIRSLLDSNIATNLVCYTTGIDVPYYTCFTSPPDKTYVESEGIFITGDPSEDIMPDYMDINVSMMCSDYNKAFANFSTIYVSTASMGGVVSSSIGEIRSAVNQLSNISSLYCQSRGSYPIGLQRACTTLTIGRESISQIPNVPKGLAHMSTTLFNSLSNMDNLYVNSFRPAYSGLNACINIT